MESGDTEESWYECEYRHEGVNTHDIFTEHEDYRYCINFDSRTSCSFDMIVEAANSHDVPDKFLFSVMQDARVHVVQQLLEEGITPLELDIARE